ncbi:Uncharacterised protein [Achromobacter sp. 2789STDY5608633]|uniref:hypothetical protein n=1 Tax=Achromobacter sp. 2789STDY5608633 TaxID=1806501 RepID=UPI0006C26452|nr:hypothetical protein [Achromobacter sp. 2789STDY5608633]CUJ48660.1 Uncharacterised protein [Achromobacter sp. 2789STDY5608633]
MSVIYLADRDTQSVAAIARKAAQGCELSKAWLPYTKMPEQHLKDLWDQWDAISMEGEMAYLELNRRGLGSYCPI